MKQTCLVLLCGQKHNRLLYIISDYEQVTFSDAERQASRSGGGRKRITEAEEDSSETR